MVTDGDEAAAGFKRQILNRGFTDADLVDQLTTLAPLHDLEDQLIADGHEALLRKALSESEGPSPRLPTRTYPSHCDPVTIRNRLDCFLDSALGV